MNRILKKLTLLGLLFWASVSYSQDEHFSQFYALPIHMNPAMTGAYDGTFRLTAINRDQWSNKLEAPFRTFAAGGDTRINMKIRQRKTEDRIGIGLFFISDQVALYQANTNKLSSYFSYHKRLGDKNTSYLGAGIKLGIIQRNINYDNLTFQDQFNQIDGFDQPTHHFNNPTFSYFSKVDDTDLNPNTDISQKLESKIVVHLSMDRKLNYSLALQPRIVFQKQAEHNQFDIGSNIEYTFTSRNNALIFGLWLTALSDLDGGHIENITPLVGLRHKRFILGLSYDIHLRDAFDSTFGYNTFEVSIRFSGVTEQTGAYCPTF